MTTRPADERMAHGRMAHGRIDSLDVIRGVAVMGILLANLPGFALPEAAYFSPLACGGSSGPDRWAWFATFVLVEGKMRGLFTFLFGASMLLVIDRAEATGDDPAAIHFRRMATLFLIGCLHLYLFWWGDILAHYALVGAIAYPFRHLPVRWLVAAGIGMVVLQSLNDVVIGLSFVQSAARDTPDRIATWTALRDGFGMPSAATLMANVAGIRGGFVDAAAWRWTNEVTPFAVLPLIGLQTLGAMLLGMAGYRSGFLTGAWARARYARWAALCLGIAMPLYGWLALTTIARGFDPRWVFFASIVASEPIRPIMVTGYAALLILMVGTGRVTRRFAMVGRAAFTNYLGTTLIMTFVFSGWGLGQFARWPRASLYGLAPLVWIAMLAGSKPWLDRYRYGPFEWMWRSLARWQRQPMRRAGNTTNRPIVVANDTQSSCD